MRRLALLSALAGAVSFAGCHHPAPPTAPAPTPAPRSYVSPGEELREAASRLAREHATPVDEQELLRAAARALDAGDVRAAGAPGVPPASPDLDAALRRFRAGGGDDRRALRLAVAAMASALGGSATYIPPEELTSSYRSPPPQIGGVGVVLKAASPFPIITRIIPGSPAAEAQVGRGVELRGVDGRSTSGLPLHEIVAMLRGATGSAVTLTLGSLGQPGREVTLARRRVDKSAVDCRVLAHRVLYLGVDQLGSGTVGYVRAAATAAVRDSIGGAPSAIVLDLRGNAGGLLETAWALADELIPSGPLLAWETRSAPPQRIEAKPGSPWLEAPPVVVLVDGATGSGAELVAAAVQDDRRGKVVGARTAGRARLESLHETSGGVIRFPMGRLLRASGAAVDGEGVTPDVVIDPAAPGPAEPVRDVACEGIASPGPVAADPVVAAAVAVLGAR